MADEIVQHRSKSAIFPQKHGQFPFKKRASSNRNLYWFSRVPESYELPSIRKKALEMQAVSQEEDEQGERVLNTGMLVTTFLEFTTSHGISHVYNAKGLIKKVIWVLLSIAAIILLSLHMWVMITGYISFSVTTNVEIAESRSMDFPAVTICNNNGIKQSKIPRNILEIVEERQGNALNGTDNTRSNKKTYRQLAEEFALLNSSQRQELGFSLNDLVIYCTFNADNCDDDFWTYFDSNYGNCYTFNSGKTTLRKTSLAGPANGLTLIINIGIHEYIPFLTEDAGVKVVVHDQKAMPFPDRDGLSASPGQVNNIAIKKTKITRQSGRYGNCTQSTHNLENMYFEPYNVSYTQWACLRTCYQKELVRRCKCFDPDLPYDSSSMVFTSIPAASAPCRTSNSENAQCSVTISDEFTDGSLKCPFCFQPCVETLYDGALSTSIYPAQSYIGDFIELLNRTHPLLLRKLRDRYGSEHITSTTQSNFLKLNIFYQSLTYTTYTQEPSYSDFQFVSDLGGAYGLWIGWSVLTIFELLEFAVDLVVFFFYRCKHNQDAAKVNHT